MAVNTNDNMMEVIDLGGASSQEASNVNKTIFTEAEQRILNLTKAKRIETIEVLFKEGVPEKVGTLRIANEIMESLDKSIQSSAQNRLKYQETQTQGETAMRMANLVKSLAEARSKKRPNGVLETDDNYKPDDLVDGEIDIHPDPLDPSEYLAGIV